ncbi:unnamed protein product [Linum tenue]|uniref:Uncharacterized protein n=1 Tax=Linum tenue TaxID=586396 RepID=A0AAV0LHJ4_9ROSI|nr:unnamed protein product [Linum tenue]
MGGGSVCRRPARLGFSNSRGNWGTNRTGRQSSGCCSRRSQRLSRRRVRVQSRPISPR